MIITHVEKFYFNFSQNISRFLSTLSTLRMFMIISFGYHGIRKLSFECLNEINKNLDLFFIVSGQKLNIFLALILFKFCWFEFILQILAVKFHLTVILFIFISTFAFLRSLYSHFCSWDSYPFWYYSILLISNFTKCYVSADNWLINPPLSAV